MSSTFFICCGPCKQKKSLMLRASGEENLCLSCRNSNRSAILSSGKITTCTKNRYSHKHYHHHQDSDMEFEDMMSPPGELAEEDQEWRDFERQKGEKDRIAEERANKRSSMGHISKHRGDRKHGY